MTQRSKTHPNPPLSGREQNKGRLGGVKFEEKRNFIPYKSKLKEYARRNRKNPTPAEQLMWRILRDKQFEAFKFTRQKPLDTFSADFYCAEFLLVIEIDGDSHATQKDYDDLRSDLLKERYNIEVVRFTNSDVLHNLDGVYKELLTIIEKLK